MQVFEIRHLDTEKQFIPLYNEYKLIEQEGKFRKWFLDKTVQFLTKHKYVTKKDHMTVTQPKVTTIHSHSIIELIDRAVQQEMYLNYAHGKDFKLVMGSEYFYQLKIDKNSIYIVSKN